MSRPLILQKHNGFYNIPLFEELNLRAVFTTRKYNMSLQNTISRQSKLLRKKVYRSIGLNWFNLVCPSQVHGDSVVVVRDEYRGTGAFSCCDAIQGTDALITDKSGVPLAILTADCLPVFMFDLKKKVIAMVHGGWRGLHKKIVTRTIQRMKEVFSINLSDLIIVLGPALRSCCYEVGEDFLKYFQSYTCSRNSKSYFDMIAAALKEITDNGVLCDHIYDSRICTSCRNDEFFSYRKEGSSVGRIMSVMEIR